MNQKDLNF